MDPHRIPTSTQTKHRTFPSTFVVARLQFTSTDEPPFAHRWDSITFYNLTFGLEKQNHLLKLIILFSAKPMILFFVILKSSSLQITAAITSKNLFQPDDPWITELPATHYDCSKQNNLRQFSLSGVEKCAQAHSETENI